MFFVAEIGSNWEGSVHKAFVLMNECKEAGANAVKFQMWRADDLYEGKYKEYELSFHNAKLFKEYADDLGIEFFCSVFYPEAVDFLETLGVKRYKIASRTIKQKDPHSVETLQRIHRTQKSIIFSNGFKIDFIGEGWKQLYCIPEYPANPDDINWKQASMCDGFSDHTLGIDHALNYAIQNPDKILEKHVKLEDSKGPDAFFSITTQELATLITLSTS